MGDMSGLKEVQESSGKEQGRISHRKMAGNLLQNGFEINSDEWRTYFKHRTGDVLTVVKSWGDLPVSRYLPRIAEVLKCSEEVALEVIFDGKILESESDAKLVKRALDAANGKCRQLGYISSLSSCVASLPEGSDLRLQGEGLLDEIGTLFESLKSFITAADKLHKG